MASLSLLPIEIIHNIAKSLDEGDLLALRMTSKALNNNTVEAHLDSLYSCCHVCLLHSSLHDLVTTSRNNLVNFRVRHLVISNLVPRDLNYRYYNEEYDDPDAIEVIMNAATGVLESQISGDKTLETLWYKYFDVSETREGLPEEIGYLALAFTGLSNLRTIEFAHRLPRFGNADRKGLNNLAQSPAIMSGNHNSQEYVRTNLSGKIWGVVMSAIALSQLQNLENIGCKDLSDGFTLPYLWLSDFHRFSKTYSPLLNLKSVEFEFGIMYSEISAAALVGPALFSWLTVVGRSLRSLKINIYLGRTRQYSFGLLSASSGPVYLKSGRLLKLEYLSLEGLELDVDDLEGMSMTWKNFWDTLEIH
ncbi:hypothetical protein H072_11248 [Dactylellina haptotyla CBS 200.50]|uniref:F-box domain-containing protein n=1 Tax=Dactylellina haptotyla (strain CBS 200.50) TaxID=1284197 RepID=S8A2J0_DACHA|nr:hypothetical protein H072_11248 [Dactylellina haptotyla CBS 200.50]